MIAFLATTIVIVTISLMVALWAVRGMAKKLGEALADGDIRNALVVRYIDAVVAGDQEEMARWPELRLVMRASTPQDVTRAAIAYRARWGSADATRAAQRSHREPS